MRTRKVFWTAASMCGLAAVMMWPQSAWSQQNTGRNSSNDRSSTAQGAPAPSEQFQKPDPGVLGGSNRQDDASSSTRIKSSQSGSKTEGSSSMQLSQSGQQQHEVIRASQCIGKNVKNAQDQTLGEIQDIVLDVDQGRVAYAVLSVDPGFFSSEKYFAIPWQAIKQEGSDKDPKLTLDVPKEKFQQAQGFDKNNWPSMADYTFAQGVYQQYGYQPYWQQNGQSQAGQQQKTTVQTGQPKADLQGQRAWMHRSSKLIGTDVRNREGKDLGEIQDIVIDQQSGRVAYAVLSFGGFMGMGDKYFAIPWEALDTNAQQQQLVLNIQEDRLKNAQGFDKNNWPDMANPQWGQDVHAHFGYEPYWSVYSVDVEPMTGWDAGSQYNRLYNRQDLQTISGTIESVDRSSPMQGMSEGTQVRIRTENQGLVTVQLGPSSFIRQQPNLNLKEGQQVQITGSRATVNGQSVILAQQARINNQTVQFRNEQGQPLWKAPSGMQQQQGQQQQLQQQQNKSQDATQGRLDRTQPMNQTGRSSTEQGAPSSSEQFQKPAPGTIQDQNRSNQNRLPDQGSRAPGDRSATPMAAGGGAGGGSGSAGSSSSSGSSGTSSGMSGSGSGSTTGSMSGSSDATRSGTGSTGTTGTSSSATGSGTTGGTTSGGMTGGTVGGMPGTTAGTSTSGTGSTGGSSVTGGTAGAGSATGATGTTGTTGGTTGVTGGTTSGTASPTGTTGAAGSTGTGTTGVTGSGTTGVTGSGTTGVTGTGTTGTGTTGVGSSTDRGGSTTGSGTGTGTGGTGTR